MQFHSSSPIEAVKSFWGKRRLMFSLSQREILGRYRGSFMGILWSFFTPLLMLIVYTFVFSVIFKARWDAGSDSRIEFALILFAGLMTFNFFAECITRSTSLITSNVNYVKKVVFPLEILPWVSLGAALFHFAISLLVWLIAYLIFFGLPHTTIFYLPIIFTPFVFLIMGITYFLSALGVYMRDISQLVGVAITALLFMSPIFYPASALPEKFQRFLMLNPLTPIIEMTRDVMFFGISPGYKPLAIYCIISMLVAWVGFVWFQKTRKGFADVL